MTEGDREEFERKLAVLFAGIDKPLGEAQREAFWRGLAKMELIEFNRSVDLLLRELEEWEGPPKRFSVADVWQAKKRLRAGPPRTLAEINRQAELAWDGDEWDLRANGRLLKHIVHSLHAEPQRYGAKDSPQMRDTVKRLVSAKNAWSADMRDLETHSGTPAQRTQDSIWADYIGRAAA